MTASDDPFGLDHERLRALAIWLRPKGFDARVFSRPGVDPYLRVVNEASKDLAEQINCRSRADGEDTLWFFWSWGDPICAATELEKAVDAIEHVLATVE